MAKSKITIQQFRKWNKAKQAEWLGNVSKRIRLPDAALPADLRAKRETSQRNRTEISPGSGVTFGDVAKQRKYTEGLTFGAGDKELADRAANAVTGRQGSADWFKTYQQQVTGAADRAGAAVTAAGENNRGLFDSMNKLSQEDTDRVQAAVRARAAELGQAAPDAGGLQGAQGAAATRAAMLGNAAITSNNEAAANAQFRNVGVNAAGLADNQNQANWDARDKAIAGDKTAYADKKGLWRQKFLDDAINSARKGVLEDKAFGLDSAAELEKARLAKAKLAEAKRAARERERIAQQNADTSRNNSNKPPAADKPKSPYRVTGAANQVQKNEINKALTWAKKLAASGNSQSGIRSILSSGGSVGKTVKDGGTGKVTVPAYGRDAVNTALDIFYLKHIGPQNYAVWRKAGYDPNKWGWPVVKKGKKGK